MDTVEEIYKVATGKGQLTQLLDPELYIIVNSKTKSKKTIWQSLVHLDELKAAVRKLKAINWLYAEINEDSLDDTSRHVVGTLSDTSSIMLEKVSAEDLHCEAAQLQAVQSARQ